MRGNLTQIPGLGGVGSSGGLEAETASASCPFSASENGGSNHDQTTAQGARNRMGGIQRTQLEPRTFDIDPQRMF